SRLVREIVTTRMTLAVPMTIPSPVRRVRAGLARRASALKRKASPIKPRTGRFDVFDPSAPDTGLAALRLLEELLGVGTGRIFWREGQGHVVLEEIACNS